MKQQRIPDYLNDMVTTNVNAFCDTLHNPSLWSENIIKETLTRTGSQTFDINEVQTIVKDYLVVLSDKIRRGETL